MTDTPAEVYEAAALGWYAPEGLTPQRARLAAELESAPEFRRAVDVAYAAGLAAATSGGEWQYGWRGVLTEFIALPSRKQAIEMRERCAPDVPTLLRRFIGPVEVVEPEKATKDGD